MFLFAFFFIQFCLFCCTSAHESTKVQIKSADGTALLSTVYYYEVFQLRKKNPIVLIRTPYGTGWSKDGIDYFLKRGYVVVVQDIRGTKESTGEFALFRHSGDDGLTTLEWIVNQKWSNGKVYTIGASAPGCTQNFLHVADPYHKLHLPLAQCPIVASTDAYGQMLYQGGAYRFSMINGWLHAQGKDSYVKTVLDNECYNDEYFSSFELSGLEDNLRVPTIHVGGWLDIFQRGTIDGWNKFRKNSPANSTFIVLNSGGHCGVSDIDFPDGQIMLAGALTYCEKMFSGDPHPLDKNVYFYVLNLGMNGTTGERGNFWVAMDDFPVPTYEKFYLTKDNKLSNSVPVSGEASFEYNPKNPTPTKGGNNLLIPCGPQIQNGNEERADNIVFTTDALTSDYAFVGGKISVALSVSSNQTDTDFVCRLSDVYPDGTSLLLNDGIVRMKWREDKRKPHLMTPGEKYQIEIDMWGMAAVVLTGHRLRLTCTSSNFPRFAVNGNSGKNLADEKVEDYKVATNTIYFGEDSYLSIPAVEMEVLRNSRVNIRNEFGESPLLLKIKYV